MRGKIFFVLVLLIIFGCNSNNSAKGTNEVSDKIIDCLKYVSEQDSVTYIDVSSVSTPIKIESFSIDEEVYDMGNGFVYTNYSIVELDENGNFDRLVEEKNDKLNKYKSFFSVDGKEYTIENITRANDVAPYNFLIDSVGYIEKAGNYIYVANISADCEACFERLIYKIALFKNESPNYSLCSEYLLLE